MIANMNNEKTHLLGNKFLCQEILRHLPGRRIVISGQWNTQEVIAKIFIKSSHHHAADFSREVFGYDVVQRYLPDVSPKLVYKEENDEVTILLYEKKIGPTLHHVWNTYSAEKKYATVAYVIGLVKRLHQHNIVHSDPHFANILMCNNDEICLLDCGSMRKIPRIPIIHPLYNLCRKYHNLAQILAQIPPGHIRNTLDLVRGYLAESCQWATPKQKILEHWINFCVYVRKKRYLKKIFRTCSLVVKYDQKDFYGHYLREFKQTITEILENPNLPFEQPVAPLLKNGNSNTVTTHFIGDTNTVVKRYNIKTFFHFLRRRVKPSRAKYSWRNAHLLQFYGINTATPIAWIQCKKWGFNYQSFFISEHLDGPHALDYISSLADPKQKELAFAKMRDLLQSLHDLGFTHRDAKGTNIIFVKDEPYFIDLDTLSISRIKNVLGNRFKKDWHRFERNWTTYTQPSI